MNNKIELRRILVFLAFAYGIAWFVALVLYLNGGLTSPIAFPLLTFGYMMAPAIAHVLARVITREGWQNNGLRPNFKHGWRYWLIAWVLPGLLVIAGAAVYFLVFPQYFDPNLTQMQESLPLGGFDPWLFIGLQTAQAILIAPLVNSLFTFGEEFGWRAYLLPKLMPLGSRKAMITSGIIWGAWHWPLTAMGHNYGLDYPGFPFLGMLVMVWMTFTMGIIFSWVTLRSGSVWPAVIGHAAVNGIGALPFLFIQGQPSALIGPGIQGLLGGIMMAAVALVLFFHPRALADSTVVQVVEPEVMKPGLSADRG